jgi:hypothetical protein
MSLPSSRYVRKPASLHVAVAVDETVDTGVASSALPSAASISSGDDRSEDNGETERPSGDDVSTVNPGG